MQLIGAGTVVRIDQNQFRRVFPGDGLHVAPLKPEQVFLETAPILQPDGLLGSHHRRPAGIPQTGNDLGGGDERITLADFRQAVTIKLQTLMMPFCSLTLLLIG